MEKLKLGKISDQVLSEILKKYTNIGDDRVLLGPKIGEDAAIIDMSQTKNNCIAVCVDPILVDIKNAPLYAVAINVNDIVTRGAIPKWGSASVFFPEGITLSEVNSFFEQLYESVRKYRISLVTGHTEITTYVKNPGIVLTLIGEVDKDDIIRTSGAEEGDSLILTGGVGIEGTAILASDLYDQLAGKVDLSLVRSAQNFIYEPGICIAPAAYISWKYKPNSLHDPTEGGVRKGIEEVAIASDKGVFVEYDKIPILEETRVICKATGDDPLGIFGSGALLISIPGSRSEELLEEYKAAGIVAEKIGKITPKEEGRILMYQGRKINLEASYTDGLIDRLNK